LDKFKGKITASKKAGYPPAFTEIIGGPLKSKIGRAFFCSFVFEKIFFNSINIYLKYYS